MKVLIQRVHNARVEVDRKEISAIGVGLLLFVSISKTSQLEQVAPMVTKIANLRIFENEQKKLDKNILDIKGSILIVSQFTLHASCKKGRRPDFGHSAPPEKAREYIELFTLLMKEQGISVQTGMFGADMNIYLTNNGPLTILLDADEL